MQKELPPIFERTDINTLPLSDTHEKGLCFQYLWELLFLRLTPIFAPLLTDTLSRRPFLRWTVRVRRCVCHTSANNASARNKGLGLSQQAKRTRPGRGRIWPFFGSVATLPMLAQIVFLLFRFSCFPRKCSSYIAAISQILRFISVRICGGSMHSHLSPNPRRTS